MSRVNEFWNWFGLNAGALAAEVRNPSILQELDVRVQGLSPGLSWEVGPGFSKPWQLVISPNLDRSLRKTAQSIVAEAPTLHNWEFHSTRQPKDWDYRFEIEVEDGGGRLAIDAKHWSFVLLQYPDGVREIQLKSISLPILSNVERWRVGAIVLESVLGENVLLDAIDEFEIVSEFEPRFAAGARPIQSLRAAVMGSEPLND